MTAPERFTPGPARLMDGGFAARVILERAQLAASDPAGEPAATHISASTTRLEAVPRSNGGVDPWHRLSAEEQAAIVADAGTWRVGLADSLARAGFDSPADYLAATAALRGEHPDKFAGERVGLADSLARAGFDSPADYLAATAALRGEHPDKFAGEPDNRSVEPGFGHPEPASGLGEYLSAVRAFLCRYVAFPSEHEPIAIALWVAHAHLVERFETSPILAVTSAEMRSGKTRTLDCLEVLVPHPFRVVIPSEAVVYTVLSQRPRPTLLLDEADAIFGPRTAERYEGVRAILNSGNRTGTPVLRVKLEGKRREVERFDVFGPKAIAGIGDLPSTVTDRSIPIRLKRRAPGEVVARFRRRTAEAEASAIRLDTSAVTVVTDGTGAEAATLVPEELPDRAADSWEVLLSIADAAGGSWPMFGRLAAMALSSEDVTPISGGMRLLADVREAFGNEDHLGTGELLRRLHDMDDAPWADWYGSPLSARGLAKLLGPYRVLPVLRRVRGERARGYFAHDFADAWARYVLPSPALVTTVTTVTTVTPNDDEPPAVTGVTDGTGAEAATGESPPDGDDVLQCSNYLGHQLRHRRLASGWVCPECSPERDQAAVGPYQVPSRQVRGMP